MYTLHAGFYRIHNIINAIYVLNVTGVRFPTAFAVTSMIQISSPYIQFYDKIKRTNQNWLSISNGGILESLVF